MSAILALGVSLVLLSGGIATTVWSDRALGLTAILFSLVAITCSIQLIRLDWQEG